MASKTTDNVILRVMRKEDYKNVRALLKEDFLASEPLCQFSGIASQWQNEEKRGENKEKYEKFDDNNLEVIAQGTSLVALDEDNGGRLVGFVLAEAQFPEDIEKHRIEAEASRQIGFGRIRVILSKVEREANIFERFGISKVLYSNVTSVDASMRGKGIGSRLAAALMDVGRSKGFPAMVAYCTSFYSARQKEALGMQCIYSLAYADYKDDQERPIFTPAEPNTMLRVMAIKL
ncbi:dopamine N-acetyltransferase-like [Drosophila elegans]|uniref:dopamine N-acetyltransferase-like n=1 Tax=Drosophila elegans TaxID=30023 RepID=UPI0007E7DECC|nr:dopamine N-acetyltransferase-like [Drosophila elegans]